MSQMAAVLNSWKEIAGYLGRGVRTVQRYERDSRLPVRRISGNGRGAVVAFSNELDVWLEQSTARKESFADAQCFRASDALRIHQLAIGRLKSNLRVMRERIEDGQRIQADITTLNEKK